MIFQHTYQQVLDGTKTQTRRLVKSSEWLAFGLVWRSTDVRGGKRVVWQVGRTYAVCPGRGKSAVGRIKITKIERQHLNQMTREDGVAEGFGFASTMAREDKDGAPRLHFAALWNRIHTKPGTRWMDNPEVWVIHFELVD